MKVYPPEELNKVMQISDYVVVSLPSTPATDKFVSKEAISQLQSHAVLINLGRGTTIDEEALIEGKNSLYKNREWFGPFSTIHLFRAMQKLPFKEIVRKD